jgi:AbrB family looped-hinge helix DNA binding protein
MTAVTISPKFQIVIPKEIREKADLQPGQKVEFFLLSGRIVIVPLKPMEEGYGFLPGLDTTIENEPDRDL